MNQNYISKLYHIQQKKKHLKKLAGWFLKRDKIINKKGQCRGNTRVVREGNVNTNSTEDTHPALHCGGNFTADIMAEFPMSLSGVELRAELHIQVK